ncbi:DNA-binding NarL/FixJ family response regulator [Variovorax boronicumulans]|uniref:DNA-binding NarL/FixJ family response regulator n=1 Tax=Variovorax boronicumulans TaxID=436515 RepID=A0AAW8D3I8_9BURK|nr:response regulator transcription factor [Variovorax boronicumulans]MDP9896031.1 DNA-binding NarL/FixJ family response regulator [Variovorax boronicumulans]MDQ0056071.1 DNA-binding NarL/FixJ family response regulator [Variovorax boronicumulans]
MSTGKADPAAAAAAATGAFGHLFNEASEDELAALMFSMERSHSPGASRIARHMLALIAAAAKSRPPSAIATKPRTGAAPPAANVSLSPRELQVLQLVSQGLSNRRIAEALSRSANTIDTQIKSIYRKLDVNSRTRAVRAAMEQGLLSWDAGRPQ